MRPVSRPFIICAKPLPVSPPRMAEAGDAAVVEGQLAALDALVAQLGQIPRDRQARVRSPRARCEMPRVPRRRAVGSVLHSSAIRPDRRALVIQVFAPLITSSSPSADRGRRHVLQVRAAARFGQRHGRPELAGSHRRQIGPLLRLGAEQCQQLGDHGVAAHRAGQAHPAPGQLLGHHDVARHRHAASRRILRDRQPEDPDAVSSARSTLRDRCWRARPPARSASPRDR